jgi:hypothetical protein
MTGVTTEAKGSVITDAPLLKEFNEGYWAFARGIQVTENGQTIDHTVNKYHANPNSMAYREWERGFNKRYYENLGTLADPSQDGNGERRGFSRGLRRRANRHAATKNIVSSEANRNARYNSGVCPSPIAGAS